MATIINTLIEDLLYLALDDDTIAALVRATITEASHD